MLQTFEKIGYAIDSYLGHISVSPRYLGSGLEVEGVVEFELREKMDISEDIENEVRYDKQTDMRIEEEQKQIHFRSMYTLAPNLNEGKQI